MRWCSSLVQMHGGEVDVHSDGPGKGARFTVRLPIEWASVSQPAVESTV